MASPVLYLLQLADSALPIGAAAHSFGLEGLVEQGTLNADNLGAFLHAYLEEAGVLEATYCAAAHRSPAEWRELDQCLEATKPSRETREASATLGRRLLALVSALDDSSPFDDAAPHLAIAFGLAGAAIGVDADTTTAAFLHVSLTGLVSAAQRLMPVGQTHAARLLWDLKPAIARAAAEACTQNIGAAAAFSPLLEIASMRHARLHTRLFIS